MKQPLYIKRSLIHSDQFLLWCKRSGFNTRLPSDDLHTTLAYSKEPVDLSSIVLKKDIVIDANSKRELKMFGDAVVLIFYNEELIKRWNELRDLGCSWDYPDYHPHITITYNKPYKLDIDTLLPYSGQLFLSEEIAEEIDDNKEDSYKEVLVENRLYDW